MKKIEFYSVSNPSKKELIAINRKIRSLEKDQQWINSKENENFYKGIQKYTQCQYQLGSSSGTSALEILLRSHSQKKYSKSFFSGQKIIVTPFTFSATPLAVLNTGAEPVFVDIEPTYLSIDLKNLETVLSKQKDIVGIVLVNIFGLVGDIKKIYDIAKKYNLFVIEDCAQAIGSDLRINKNYKANRAFSFFPTKVLGCYGDGGLISTDDKSIYEIALKISSYGGSDKNDPEIIGTNSRLDSIQAAILNTKLTFLKQNLNIRKKLSSIYIKELHKNKHIHLPDFCKSNFYLFPILTEKRDLLKDYLKENNIETQVFYDPPLHLKNLFLEFKTFPEKCPSATYISKRLLLLPIYEKIRVNEIKYICEKINKFFED